MSVFDQLRSYVFVHHRALNDFAALEEAKATVARFPDQTHAVEGDVCWNFADGREDLYFRHPRRVFDSLSTAAIARAMGERKLVRIEDLKTLANANVFVIIELKVGRGDWRAALARLVAFMQANFSNRFWIDGFSPRLLTQVKKIAPAVTTTLHTECVWGKRVLTGAPEWPPFGMPRLADLAFADGIAIRWRGQASFMARAVAAVKASGKRVFVSRLHALEQYRLTREWHADGGYIHFDFAELLAYDAARQGAPQVREKTLSHGAA